MISFDQIEVCALTDVGVKRGYNQDSFYSASAESALQWSEVGHLYLVADGMGAHAVGEKASEQAVKIIPHVFGKLAREEGGPVSMRKALLEANFSIHECGQQNTDFKGMGTTATALALRPEGAWIGHVGDSRVYRIKNQKIEQLTYDHSLVWEYAKLKKIDPDEVKDIPSNYINKCLGPEPLVEPDVEGPYPLAKEDKFLLCSDGLSGQMEDVEIGAVISCLPIQEACEILIHASNIRGGPDNITAILVHVKPSENQPGQSPNAPDPETLEAKLSILQYLRKIDLGAPWWVISLLVGAFSAFGSAAVFLNQIPGPWALFLIIFSLASVFSGMVGLVRQILVSRGDSNPENTDPQPRIHRSKSIQYDLKLVEKFQLQVDFLKRWLADNEVKLEGSDLTVDKSLLESTLAQAQADIKAKNFRNAFKGYCQAILLLVKPWNYHRPNGPKKPK